MALKWYRRTAIQAAFVTGIFGLIAVIISGLFGILGEKENHTPKEDSDTKISGPATNLKSDTNLNTLRIKQLSPEEFSLKSKSEILMTLRKEIDLLQKEYRSFLESKAKSIQKIDQSDLENMEISELSAVVSLKNDELSTIINMTEINLRIYHMKTETLGIHYESLIQSSRAELIKDVIDVRNARLSLLAESR